MSALTILSIAYVIIAIIIGLWVAIGTHNSTYFEAFFTVFFVGTLWPLAIFGTIYELTHR